MPIYVEFDLAMKISYPNHNFFLGLKKIDCPNPKPNHSNVLAMKISHPKKIDCPNPKTNHTYALYPTKYDNNFVPKFWWKKYFFPLHFYSYVGTGMRTTCRFCTGFRNHKNHFKQDFYLKYGVG